MIRILTLMHLYHHFIIFLHIIKSILISILDITVWVYINILSSIYSNNYFQSFLTHVLLII